MPLERRVVPAEDLFEFPAAIVAAAAVVERQEAAYDDPPIT
jgi:hypothetical protein